MLKEQVEKLLTKASQKSKTLQFAMNLPALGIDYSYSSPLPNQKFHSASVGKLMTATLVFMAIEQGKLTLDTVVRSVLEPGKLDRLFIVENEDFQGKVTVKHLLTHTSGINDYFESKTIDGSNFIDEVIKNPEVFWTPDDLLDFTRHRQKAIARPGEKYLYSDTGYVLLGQLIEAVFKMPFHQTLDTLIFGPSQMQDTSLCFYSERFDQTALAPLYLNGTDVHLFKSLSCDYSGGGLSTTSKDLIKFLDYLMNERFISKPSLTQMSEFTHRFRQGLYYGTGMMQIHFEEFFFLLKNLPRLQGHLGVTGVHTWYDPATKSSFVLNVGNTKDMTKSFTLLIKILQLVQKEYQKR